MFRVKKKLSVCLSNVFDNLQIYKSIAAVLVLISVSLYCHISKWTNLNIEGLVIKFLIKQAKTPKIIREEILRIFANGQNCLSMVEKSLDDDLRPGRPVDTITMLSKKPSIWYWKI
jgi:hypothetical protein